MSDTIIKLRYSDVPSKVPTVGTLAPGELALNGADGKLYLEKTNGTIAEIGGAGSVGPQGPAGPTGATGPQGPQGLQGDVGPQGPAGVQGVKGDTGAIGPQGPQGLQGPAGATGPQGPAGTSGSSAGAFATLRYQAVSTAGQGVNITVGTRIEGADVSWTRSGTSMTVTKSGHTVSVGEQVIILDSNVAQLAAVVTSLATVNATNDSFVITCANTGATSGALASYARAFTFRHVKADYSTATGATDISGGILAAPANAKVVLLSLRINLASNTRLSVSYFLQTPASAVDGAGDNTSVDDMYVPMLSVRSFASDSLSAVGAVLNKNFSSNLAWYNITALSSNAVANNIALNW